MTKLTGVFISGYKGEEIEVTDLEAALKQARDAVAWNEWKIIRHKRNPDELIFPEALKEWKHILLELELVEMKLKAQPEV